MVRQEWYHSSPSGCRSWHYNAAPNSDPGWVAGIGDSSRMQTYLRLLLLAPSQTIEEEALVRRRLEVQIFGRPVD